MKKSTTGSDIILLLIIISLSIFLVWGLGYTFMIEGKKLTSSIAWANASAAEANAVRASARASARAVRVQAIQTRLTNIAAIKSDRLVRIHTANLSFFENTLAYWLLFSLGAGIIVIAVMRKRQPTFIYITLPNDQPNPVTQTHTHVRTLTTNVKTQEKQTQRSLSRYSNRM